MKKLLTIIICSLLLLSFVIVSCEKEDLGTATIYGVVSDKVTGEPVKSADVELLPVGIKTRTGTDGHYEFNNLKAGNYQICINLTNYQDVQSQIELGIGQSLRRDVSMELLPPALRVVNDARQDITELDFGSAETDITRSFNLLNDGAEKLEWEITYTADWIKSINKTQGVLEVGKPQSFIVTIDRTKLVSGINTTTLHITSNNGSKQLTLKAVKELLLPALKVVDDYRLDISELNFGTAKTDVSRSFNIFNDGAETLKWKITYTADWIKSVNIKEGVLEPSKTETIIVIINRSVLTEEQNITTLHITSNNGSKQLTLKVGNIPSKEDTSDNNPSDNNNPSDSNNPSDNNTSDNNKPSDNLPSKIEDLPTFNFNAAKYYVYPDAGAMDWDNAMAYCDKVNFAGYDDWYLPTSKELKAMFENKTAIGGFTTSGSSKNDYYWSSSEYANPLSAYYKRFNQYGSEGIIEKEEVIRVRCVRKNNTPSYEYSPTAVSRLEDLPTFNYNAAKYYVYPEAGAMDWDNAMAYCDKVNVAGYDDWYLPNVKESKAMYENRTTIGGFKTSVTGKAGWYWTGEEYANPLGAYYKMFNKYIGDGSEAKEEVLRVRCVRKD